jgi:ribonucleotide monophosphatase NagD (HAD superfamily)
VRDRRARDARLAPTRLSDAYVFDLDGTIYLGERLLPGPGA